MLIENRRLILDSTPSHLSGNRHRIHQGFEDWKQQVYLLVTSLISSAVIINLTLLTSVTSMILILHTLLLFLRLNLGDTLPSMNALAINPLKYLSVE